MVQKLALPITKCNVNAMYKGDSNPAYQHKWDAAGHFGIDMTGSVNPFYTSGDGVVINVGGTSTTGVGFWAAVQYNNVYRWNMNSSTLSTIPGIIVRYFHLASKPTLRAGDSVNFNTVIGTYGKTGQWSAKMGTHLHVKVDTDLAYPLYTPTLVGAAGGLFPGYRDSRDTTIDPASVFFLKNTAPENQALGYTQSKCDKNEYLENKSNVITNLKTRRARMLPLGFVIHVPLEC